MILSQVILGLQLPFAVAPLLWFTTRRKHQGIHAVRPITLWSIAIVPVVTIGRGLLLPAFVAFMRGPALRLLPGYVPVGDVHQRTLFFQTMRFRRSYVPDR